MGVNARSPNKNQVRIRVLAGSACSAVSVQIFFQGKKADERIQGAMSYFRKAIAIRRAVGPSNPPPRAAVVRQPLPPSDAPRVASSDADKPGCHLELSRTLKPPVHSRMHIRIQQILPNLGQGRFLCKRK